MYRFLAAPRWLAFGAIALLLAATMIGLGRWQLSRYQQRSEINERIDAAAGAQPRPLDRVIPVGAAPASRDAWSRVTVTGRYDQGHEILARARTVAGRGVGFEVLTPLVLADGTAVLIDRGWAPLPRGDAKARPEIPPAPAGEVTVVGRVHLPESRAEAPTAVDGRAEVRRINPVALGSQLPYPRLRGGYVLMDNQTPPATGSLAPIPVQKENAGQNLGYVVQWWLFALLTLLGFGWLARREATRSMASPASEPEPA